MKILHTSDWHVGRTIRGRSRAEEHRAVLAEIVGIADEEAVDLVLVAGDLFDVVAPSAESEQIVFRALLDLAGIAPVVVRVIDETRDVVVVFGSHEDPASSWCRSTLRRGPPRPGRLLLNKRRVWLWPSICQLSVAR